MNRIPRESEREDSRWTREGEKDGEEEGKKGASSSSVIGPAGVCLLGGWMETDSIQTCTAGSPEKLLAARSHKPDWHNGKKWLADTLDYHHTHIHTVKSPAEWIRPHNGALYPLWYASEGNDVHFHFFKTASSIIGANTHTRWNVP